MAFRLREDESVAKGLSRVVRKELRSAVERLTGDRSDEAIHDARKSIKKVRAVLQLVGDELDASAALKDLRRASHLLSPLRDMDAMIETARSLRSRDDATSANQSALGTHLARQKAALTADADRGDILTRAARMLDRVHRDARDWRWKRTHFAGLAKAIKRSHKRARRVMQTARDHDTPDTFHDWRKRVKTLWYALRLLEGRAPRLHRPIADFKRLETWLGDDHNLHVLQKQTRSLKASHATADGLAHLRTLMERRQRQLRRKTLALGGRLLAHSPKSFTQRVRAMWEPKSRAPQRSSAAA